MRQIMGFRYVNLQEATVGYETTGIPLVAYRPTGLYAAGATDDIGIYYFIPAIAHWLHLSVDRATDLFLGGILVISFVSGLLACLRLFETRRGRVTALLGLVVVSLFSYVVGDVYIVPSALAIALVPWLLYALSQRASIFAACIVGIGAGLAIGAGHYIRSHSGTALLVFLFTLVVCGRQYGGVKRGAVAAAVLLGVAVPVVAFTSLIAQRDAYLASRHIAVPEPGHVFWHSVYIGLGFLNNRHGILYEDSVAESLARSRSPHVVFGTREYEGILRDEVFRLVKEDPRLIGQTLCAKAGVVMFYACVFGGVGLVATLRRLNPFALELAFGAAIAFSAVPGLLIMPWASYLTGFIAWLILYGAIGVENAARAATPTEIGLASAERSG
jgi:hypothetical protein